MVGDVGYKEKERRQWKAVLSQHDALIFTPAHFWTQAGGRCRLWWGCFGGGCHHSSARGSRTHVSARAHARVWVCMFVCAFVCVFVYVCSPWSDWSLLCRLRKSKPKTFWLRVGTLSFIAECMMFYKRSAPFYRLGTEESSLMCAIWLSFLSSA